MDPAHHLSPGLSSDAMLKFPKVKLELLTDSDMLYFFMEGIRGGLSVINKRYVKINNKYMKIYDATKPSSYFITVDSNNLYGKGMSYKLPCNGFKCCSQEEIDELYDKITTLSDNSDIGYTLQVDLKYSSELHESHNDLPFIPEDKNITEDLLSKYQKKLMNKNLGSTSSTPKLVASINDKKKIIVDYRTLKQALKRGLILEKIHSAITYNQSVWLKPYIDKNTKLRRISKSDLEKDLFKLMNNAVYGKTIGNCSEKTGYKILYK